MLTIKVKGQVMKAICCETIVADSLNMLEVEFEFSDEWQGMVKVAQFAQKQNNNLVTYNVMLDVLNTAAIPNEITVGTLFISVFGVLDERRMTTAPLALPVNESGYIEDGTTPIPPTPDLYQQIIDAFNAGMAGKAAEQHTHAQSDIAGLTDALAGKAAAQHAHNPQEITGFYDALANNRAAGWLVNGYFANPINQRGFKSYSGEAQYTIDCWKTINNNAALDVIDGGIKLSSITAGTAGHLIQIVQNGEKLLGKTITYAVILADGRTIVKNDTLPSEFPATNTQYATLTADGLTIGAIMLTNSEVWARIWSNPAEDERCFVWADLFEGKYTAENVPFGAPKERQAELLTCQRYAIPLGGVFRYRACQITSGIIDFAIQLPVKMRAYPSFDTSALTVYSLNNGAMIAQTEFTFAVVQMADCGMVIRASKAGHGLQDAILSIATSTLFSAEP